MELPKDKTIANLKEYYSVNTKQYQDKLAEIEQRGLTKSVVKEQATSEYARIERLNKLQEMNKHLIVDVLV